MPDPSTPPSYETLLRKSRLKGEVEELEKGRERRQHPRIQVDALDIQVDTDSWIFVINLSVTGIAFYADTPFQLGQEVTVSLDDSFSLKAKVVESEPAGDDGPSLAGQFRVCCEFVDAGQGMDFLVHIKKLEEESPQAGLP